MEGFTYRYFHGEPLYPFGFGLSYTKFAYSDLVPDKTSFDAGEALQVAVTVKNVGARAGDEVVQLYLKDRHASVPVPVRQLAGFRRVHLAPGEARKVTFTIMPRQMSVILDDGRRVIEPGVFELFVGGGQPGTGAPGASAVVEVAGSAPREVVSG